MASAPDELTMQFVFLTAPPLPFVPEPVRGTKVIAIVVCYVGPPEEATEVLAPLRGFQTPALDMVGPIPYIILQQMLNDANPHGWRYYTKGHFFTELTDQAIDAIAAVGPTAPSPTTFAALIALGGAAGRVPEDATAMGTRDALFSLDVIGSWLDPTADEENIAWIQAVCDATEPFSSGTMYVNLAGDAGEAVAQRAYGPATYRRLAELKKKYDPDNFFRLNPNIEPAT
jgi:hypothetical protein